jgi:hypothetical protein
VGHHRVLSAIDRDLQADDSPPIARPAPALQKERAAPSHRDWVREPLVESRVEDLRGATVLELRRHPGVARALACNG